MSFITYICCTSEKNRGFLTMPYITIKDLKMEFTQFIKKKIPHKYDQYEAIQINRLVFLSWSCVLLIASLFSPVLILPSVISLMISFNLRKQLPNTVGFRSFSHNTLEKELTDNIYTPLSRISPLFVLYDLKGAFNNKSSIISQAATPLQTVRVSIIIASLLISLYLWRSTGCSLNNIMLYLLTMITGSHLAFKYCANNMFSRIVFLLPVPIIVSILQIPLIYKIVTVLILYTISMRVWNVYYLNRPFDIETEFDLLKLKKILSGKSIKQTLNIPVSNRINLFCHEEHWKNTVQTMLDNVKIVTADISYQSKNLIWEIKEAQKRNLLLIITCEHSKKDSINEEIRDIIDIKDVWYY